MRSLLGTLLILAIAFHATKSNADGTCAPAPTSTWGAPATQQPPTVDDPPVVKARDLLARAKLLDEVATADEKSAIEIAARLPALRMSAKTARDRADRASGDDREILVSRAEDLEADLAVSEAETTHKKKAAAENRRMARELRNRAVRLVREAPVDTSVASPCDPPYRFTADGRKIYRVECLK